MKIPWKLKSFIFKIIDNTNNENLLYFIQKYITGRSKINLQNVYKDANLHIQILKKIDYPNLLEFGAGKNLAQNIIFSQFCKNQLVVDLKPMADLGQINQASKEISKIEKKIKFKSCENFLDLEKHYNIRYLSPVDMRSTPFKNKQFYCCVSTNTLEHIPKDDIVLIFEELKRICKDGSSILSYIDYSDHYSHTDNKIHNLNFLKFSEKSWRKYNHNCHYQNRLRHHDFTKIFKDLRFKIYFEKAFYDNVKDNIEVSKEFDVNLKTTFATSGYFHLHV